MNEITVTNKYMPVAKKIAILETAYGMATEQGAPNRLVYDSIVVVEAAHFYTNLFEVAEQIDATLLQGDVKLEDVEIGEIFDKIIGGDLNPVMDSLRSVQDFIDFLDYSEVIFNSKVEYSKTIDSLFSRIAPMLSEFAEGLKNINPDAILEQITEAVEGDSSKN